MEKKVLDGQQGIKLTEFLGFDSQTLTVPKVSVRNALQNRNQPYSFFSTCTFKKFVKKLKVFYLTEFLRFCPQNPTVSIVSVDIASKTRN